jgi:hypothetical protein
MLNICFGAVCIFTVYPQFVYLSELHLVLWTMMSLEEGVNNLACLFLYRSWVVSNIHLVYLSRGPGLAATDAMSGQEFRCGHIQ